MIEAKTLNCKDDLMENYRISASRLCLPLQEFGRPRELPRCGGWILERPIPGFPYRDAMACYPLFSCENWSQLKFDLQVLKDDLVSLSLVTDPFGHYDLDLLRHCFDVVIPFKKHFVRDLTKPLELSRHHRRYTRRSFENVTIDVCVEPMRFLDEWTDLYAALVDRFDIKGIRAFSRASRKAVGPSRGNHVSSVLQGHRGQCPPGLSPDDVCYAHLAGFNAIGQELMASYAIYWTEIEYFADKARWLDWGGTVGIRNDDNDGLTQFKRGWSTDTPNLLLRPQAEQSKIR